MCKSASTVTWPTNRRCQGFHFAPVKGRLVGHALDSEDDSQVAPRQVAAAACASVLVFRAFLCFRPRRVLGTPLLLLRTCCAEPSSSACTRRFPGSAGPFSFACDPFRYPRLRALQSAVVPGLEERVSLSRWSHACPQHRARSSSDAVVPSEGDPLCCEQPVTG